MKKLFKIIFLLIAVLTIVYFLGSKPKAPKYETTLPAITAAGNDLENLVRNNESKFEIKPNNECRIIWFDTTKQKTEYSILYLPGFTASQAEADPIHKNIAKQFGCNLYLARLYGHGLKDTMHTFEDFTVDKYWETAKDAFVIAKQMGNKVIVMGTSTGGSLALKLAAEYNDIAALILLSPNIEINDKNAWVLNNNWGKQIATMVRGSSTFKSDRQDSVYKQYWNHRYNVNGAVELEELLESSMTNSTFKKVTEPVCLLYYYKDEKNQDPVVKVSAMKTMFDKIATPTIMKEQNAIANAGNHVIGSYIQSKDLITVEEKITTFLINKLNLKTQ